MGAIRRFLMLQDRAWPEESDTMRPKPDTPGGQRAAKRKLQDADAWAIAMVLTRAAPEGLSLITDADDQNQQRAARQSLQRRLLPAMRDYGLVNYELNGSGYKISATERLLVFVEQHYLPALRHDGWMHYFDADGVGEEHEKSCQLAITLNSEALAKELARVKRAPPSKPQ